MTTVLSSYITKAAQELKKLLGAYNWLEAPANPLTFDKIDTILQNDDNIDFNAMTYWSLINRCDEETRYCIDESIACKRWLDEQRRHIKEQLSSMTDHTRTESIILARRLLDLDRLHQRWQRDCPELFNAS